MKSSYVLFPYGWIGIIVIIIGLYFSNFGFHAIGIASMFIVGGIIMIFINLFYNMKDRIK